MILHHEVIQSAVPAIFAVIAWGLLALNAAVYYGRRIWRRVRGGK